MRDLRKEIKERLTELEVQRTSLQKQLDGLNMKEESLKVLLDAEDERWTQQLSLDTFANPKGSADKHKPLYNFILSSLTESEKSTDEILDAATKAKISFTTKRPKVVVHFTLIGMMNAQVVEKLGDLWKLKKD